MFLVTVNNKTLTKHFFTNNLEDFQKTVDEVIDFNSAPNVLKIVKTKFGEIYCVEFKVNGIFIRVEKCPNFENEFANYYNEE